MAKKPEPPKPTTWDIYRAAAKLRPLGAVEAVDENEAIKKAAAEFKVIAGRASASGHGSRVAWRFRLPVCPRGRVVPAACVGWDVLKASGGSAELGLPGRRITK
jgi:hypothetical protein